jgi:lysophospholipase L1-like esterase
MSRIFLAIVIEIALHSVTPARAADQPHRLVIEAYGDSTTEGWTVDNGIGRRTSKNAERILELSLRKEFGDVVTVVNYGAGGTEAAELLTGSTGSPLSWGERMARSPAEIILLNYGLNDAYYAHVRSAKAPQETAEQYAQILAQLAFIARGAGKTVVLEEPNPTCNRIREAALPSYVDALRAMARRESIPLVSQYDFILSLPAWTSLLGDCLHPNEALYNIKGRRTAAVLGPIVRELLK